jgi:hypothetical protein
VLQDLFLWHFKCYWVFLFMDHRCWREFCVVLFGCGVSLHMLWVHLCDFNVVVVFFCLWQPPWLLCFFYIIIVPTL